ncbi:MAG: 6-phosphogluconolactonase [Oceanicaulis sp.]
MPERFHSFDRVGSAVETLAARIVETLRAGQASRGRASLIASGGSTPEPLYRVLSGADVDWTNMDVVLADERWVDAGEAGSNEDFVRRTLLTGAAASAALTGLKSAGARPADGLAATETRLATLPWPADCAVLGMGDDGHTLSWLPHAQGLDAALAADGQLAAAITARPSSVTGALTDRVTLTMRALTGARLCALLIRGAAKREALERALAPGPVEDMPVRALLRHPALEVQIFWSP